MEENEHGYAYWANKENRKYHEPHMVILQLVYCKKEQNQGVIHNNIHTSYWRHRGL